MSWVAAWSTFMMLSSSSTSPIKVRSGMEKGSMIQISSSVAACIRQSFG